MVEGKSGAQTVVEMSSHGPVKRDFLNQIRINAMSQGKLICPIHLCNELLFT